MVTSRSDFTCLINAETGQVTQSPVARQLNNWHAAANASQCELLPNPLAGQRIQRGYNPSDGSRRGMHANHL